jgi:hypothetical protein
MSYTHTMVADDAGTRLRAALASLSGSDSPAN